MRWSFVAFIGQEGVRALVALGLARVIGPENYGIVAQAMVFMAFTSLLLGQGVGATIVQRLELEDRTIGTGLWMTTAVASMLAILTVLLSSPLAGFFHTPELQGVLQVLALSVLIKGLSVVPQNLLIRQLRMQAIALRGLAAAIIAGGLALGAALAGAGYWALVVQILATDVMTLVVLVALVGRLPLRASRESLRDMWGFSFRVLIGQLLAFGIRNADNVIVGRVLGPVQLGLYAVSYRTMMVAVQGLAFTANRVTLPVFSRMQNQTPRLRSAFLEVSEMLAVASFPFMAICAAAAPSAVPLILGPAWEPAVPVIQILAITGAQQGVISGCTPAFIATGRADLVMRFQVFSVVVTLPAFVIGVQWGIVGVAAAYTIVSVLTWPVALAMLGRVLDFRLRDYVGVMVPSACSAAVLAGVFIAVEKAVLAITGTAWASLIAATLGGLAAFVGTYALVWRKDAERVIAAARSLALPRQPDTAARERPSDPSSG